MKLCTLLALLIAATSAQALEPFVRYDRFDRPPLDPTRWKEPEQERSVRNGALHVMQRNYGATDFDSGVTYSSFGESLANPSAVTALKARIKVNGMEVNSCPGNPILGQSRARIFGTFFNITNPIQFPRAPNSLLNDVIAQVRLTRFSNSADPAGMLLVQGIVARCSTDDCNAAEFLGQVALGTISVGEATVVQMRWDAAAKMFYFGRDGASLIGVSYNPLYEHFPPSVPTKTLSTRLDLPSCHTGPRVTGMFSASFDNVSVNASALP